MSTIIVNSSSEATCGAGWTKNPDFKSGTKITKAGVTYEIVSQESKATSILKRIGFIALTILSLGTALISSTCRDICFRGKEIAEFAVPSAQLEAERKIAAPATISLKDRAIALKDTVISTCKENPGKIAIGVAAVGALTAIGVYFGTSAKEFVKPMLPKNMTTLSQSLNPFMTPAGAFKSTFVYTPPSPLSVAGSTFLKDIQPTLNSFGKGVSTAAGMGKDLLFNTIDVMANSAVGQVAQKIPGAVKVTAIDVKDVVVNTDFVQDSTKLASAVYNSKTCDNVIAGAKVVAPKIYNVASGTYNVLSSATSLAVETVKFYGTPYANSFGEAYPASKVAGNLIYNVGSGISSIPSYGIDTVKFLGTLDKATVVNSIATTVTSENAYKVGIAGVKGTGVVLSYAGSAIYSGLSYGKEAATPYWNSLTTKVAGQFGELVSKVASSSAI